MGIFEKVSETISSTGKDVANKAKAVADFARLRHQIFAEEEKLAEFYCDLGKKYYENNASCPEEAYSDLCVEIEKSQKVIEKMTQQVNTMRGVKICENCGAEVDESFVYCGVCGTKLPETVVEAEVVEEPSCEVDFSEEESFEETEAVDETKDDSADY